MAAYYARDYRDALGRLARFKQLCTPEELQIKISKDECLIEPVWRHAQEETPPLLTDAAFASFVELGRRGTGHPVNPKRVERKRKAEATRVHEAYFKCPVKFGARRNILVLHTAELDPGRSGIRDLSGELRVCAEGSHRSGPSSRVGEECFGFFQRRDRSFSANRWEIVQELVQRIAGFEVVDERVDGNTCSPEARRAPQDFRIADDH